MSLTPVSFKDLFVNNLAKRIKRIRLKYQFLNFSKKIITMIHYTKFLPFATLSFPKFPG